MSPLLDLIGTLLMLAQECQAGDVLLNFPSAPFLIRALLGYEDPCYIQRSLPEGFLIASLSTLALVAPLQVPVTARPMKAGMRGAVDLTWRVGLVAPVRSLTAAARPVISAGLRLFHGFLFGRVVSPFIRAGGAAGRALGAGFLGLGRWLRGLGGSVAAGFRLAGTLLWDGGRSALGHLSADVAIPVWRLSRRLAASISSVFWTFILLAARGGKVAASAIVRAGELAEAYLVIPAFQAIALSGRLAGSTLAIAGRWCRIVLVPLRIGLHKAGRVAGGLASAVTRFLVLGLARPIGRVLRAATLVVWSAFRVVGRAVWLALRGAGRAIGTVLRIGALQVGSALRVAGLAFWSVLCGGGRVTRFALCFGARMTCSALSRGVNAIWLALSFGARLIRISLVCVRITIWSAFRLVGQAVWNTLRVRARQTVTVTTFMARAVARASGLGVRVIVLPVLAMTYAAVCLCGSIVADAGHSARRGLFLPLCAGARAVLKSFRRAGASVVRHLNRNLLRPAGRALMVAQARLWSGLGRAGRCLALGLLAPSGRALGSAVSSVGRWIQNAGHLLIRGVIRPFASLSRAGVAAVAAAVVAFGRLLARDLFAPLGGALRSATGSVLSGLTALAFLLRDRLYAPARGLWQTHGLVALSRVLRPGAQSLARLVSRALHGLKRVASSASPRLLLGWWGLALGGTTVSAVAASIIICPWCPPPHIEVRGLVGGSKGGLLSNPQVVAILHDDYNIVLGNVSTVSSADMINGDTSLEDFLWPADELVLDMYRQKPNARLVRSETIFYSPLVLYAWDEVSQALQRNGHVQDVDGSVYLSDFRAMSQAMLAGDEWISVGVNLPKSLFINTTDPCRSNSGNLFAALLINLRAESVADEGVLPAALPDVRRYFNRYFEQSSARLFQDFLTNGVGANPIIINYESFLIEYYHDNRAQQDLLRTRIRTIYPEPSVWASHILIATTEKGQKFQEAIKDRRIQQIAWERHGFRTGLAGVDNDPAVHRPLGIAPTVRSVMPVPRADVMNRINGALCGA